MRKTTKRLLAILLTLTMVLANTVIAFAETPDEQELIPIRVFVEEMGVAAEWDDDERSITITLVDDTYILYANSNVAFINGEELTLQNNVTIIDDYSYITLDDLYTLLTASTESRYLGTTINTAMLAAQQYAEMLSIPGITVAIVDAETGFTWTQGFGEATDGVPVDEYTLFNLASISKSFTAVAVMQLAEAGIIDLDEPVITYLPDFNVSADLLTGLGDYKNITPRMLLTHASGIHPDIMAAGVLTTGKSNPAYMDGFLEIIAEYPMASPETTAFTYANNSFTLLGVLVAELTGADSYHGGFVNYTQEKIFKPAGMELTTFALEDKHMPHLSQSYADADTPDVNLFYNALPAGGIYSNAHDMARFMHFILNKGTYDGTSILSSASVEKMLEPQNAVFAAPLDIISPHMIPGLGLLYMTGLDGFTYSGHPGNLVHFHSNMAFDMDSGLGVFVSVNSISGMPAPNVLSAALLQTAIYEKTGVIKVPESDLTVTPVAITAEALGELEGLYTFEGEVVSIVAAEGVLYIMGVPGLDIPLELIPLSDGSFINADTGLRFWFEEYEGETLLYLGEFKSILIGGKFEPELIELLSDGQGIEPWIGTYEAVALEDGYVSLITNAEVGIDENGLPYLRLYALHGLTPFSILIQLDDGLYLGDVIFTADGEDVFLEISGVILQRVQD
ncbi:MAG: serine hydrolase [Oscillospiraceae bacterium]|nr:serine hydrolase [Oscillospiraceae bacterium]